MRSVYKHIDEYNPDKENKIVIVFDDMIADVTKNKKLNSMVTDLLIRGRKRNIFLVFITQSYFKVPKDVRLNTTHLFIEKIPNKRESREITINHSSISLILISLIFLENVQLNHIRFLLMILHLHQIIL